MKSDPHAGLRDPLLVLKPFSGRSAKALARLHYLRERKGLHIQAVASDWAGLAANHTDRLWD
jgi:hypothetical protein